jgi:hypothetical protein
MKTKTRTTVSNSHAMGCVYRHMHIQVLTGRYNRKDVRHLETMGTITFQANVHEPDNWYGMSFVIETDKPDYIKRMAQLAKFIKDKRSDYNAQPKEILEIIGAEEHIVFDGEFFPASYKGKTIYDVMLFGNSLYSTIVADDEASAQKILDKMKLDKPTLKFNQVITF